MREKPKIKDLIGNDDDHDDDNHDHDDDDDAGEECGMFLRMC